MQSGATFWNTRSRTGVPQDSSSTTMCPVSTDGLRPSVVTLTPRWRSALTRCRPMNPCPPVTTALRMAQKCFAIFLEHLLGQSKVVGPPDIEPNTIVTEADHAAVTGLDLLQQARHVHVIDLRHVRAYGLSLENINAHTD